MGKMGKTGMPGGFMVLWLLLWPFGAAHAAHAAGSTPLLTPYKDSYFVIDPHTAEIKFQFSLKYRIMPARSTLWVLPWPNRLYFGYTQKSFWDFGGASAPFEEHNFNPEFFWVWRGGPDAHPGWHFLHEVTLSPYEHESNGLAGADSRSWNRRYAQAELFGLAQPEGRSGVFAREDRVNLTLKVWNAYDTAQNPLMDDYYGYGTLTLRAAAPPARFSAMLRRGDAWDKGAVETSVAAEWPALNRMPMR